MGFGVWFFIYGFALAIAALIAAGIYGLVKFRSGTAAPPQRGGGRIAGEADETAGVAVHEPPAARPGLLPSPWQVLEVQAWFTVAPLLAPAAVHGLSNSAWFLPVVVIGYV